MADECIPPARFRSIVDELRNNDPPIHAIHLLDIFRGGIQDDDWARRLRQESGWIVVTGDRGRGRSPRLPVILPALGVTGIFMSASLQNAKGDDKVEAIRWMAARIDRIAAAPPGTRFKLNKHGETFRLEEWPVTL